MTQSGLHRPRLAPLSNTPVSGAARKQLLTIWLAAFPQRTRPAVARSLANLAILAAGRQRRGLPAATSGENRS